MLLIIRGISLFEKDWSNDIWFVPFEILFIKSISQKPQNGKSCFYNAACILNAPGH